MEFEFNGIGWLAQETTGVPPSPSEAVSAPSTGSTASGTSSGSLTNPSSGAMPGNSSFLYMMFLAVIIMILFSVFRQKSDNKKRQAMLSAIKKHDRVQTVGGVLGSVVEAKSDYVVLKVDESSNTRITFARSAIQQVISQSAEPATADSKTD
ncbi:MAG TPA: preprotein translocase subunit YajC [Phycisphaerales bacterium]|nr:preprotein translocase subunit YajC [Phycisphaerales bacterium]